MDHAQCAAPEPGEDARRGRAHDDRFESRGRNARKGRVTCNAVGQASWPVVPMCVKSCRRQARRPVPRPFSAWTRRPPTRWQAPPGLFGSYGALHKGPQPERAGSRARAQFRIPPQAAQLIHRSCGAGGASLQTVRILPAYFNKETCNTVNAPGCLVYCFPSRCFRYSSYSFFSFSSFGLP